MVSLVASFKILITFAEFNHADDPGLEFQWKDLSFEQKKTMVGDFHHKGCFIVSTKNNIKIEKIRESHSTIYMHFHSKKCRHL